MATFAFEALLAVALAQASLSSEPSAAAQPQASATGVIRVTRKPLVDATISPMQCGQFIEYLCDLVPSMWAERLFDGSFEGLTPYRFVYLAEKDFKEHPWYPSGETNRGEHSGDKSTKVGGDVSRRIATNGTTPCTVGIAQDGIYVERGAACNFSIWLRAENVKGPVRARLHGEASGADAEYAACEFETTSDWKKLHARLVPSATDVNATLSIEFRGPGTLWLDNASLMPENTVLGWRPDVVAALRALKPGVIRFGGAALDDRNLGDFEWKDTIGDPDHRKPFRAWGGLQPMGAGLEEIVQLCRAVGAEPLICVRVTQRAPKDAADEVEYFNGAASTPMGVLRAKGGNLAPYHVRYWQIGNEVGGPEYEKALPEFCKAMHAVDSRIELLSSYPSEGVLRGAGDEIDFVCPHHYGCADLAGMSADFQGIRNLIHKVRGDARSYWNRMEDGDHAGTGPQLGVGVTEWNTTAGDAGPHRAMLWTLANALACARYHNLMQRNADLVGIACRSNLANSFCSGILQTDNHRLYCTPTYYAQEMYAAAANERPLTLGESDPDLDVSATERQNHSGRLFVVNDRAHEIVRTLDLSEFLSGTSKIAVSTLADADRAGEPDAVNSFPRPERVASVASFLDIAAPRFDYRFPPFSLTMLSWVDERH